MVTDNILRGFDHWRYVSIDKLIGVRSLCGCFESGMI
jgi:hypothetical protein